MNFNRLDEFLEGLVKDKLTPSVDCIVKKDGKTVYRYFSGYSDIESEKAINGNEEYLIYSMTKLFTCVCALRLLEKEKFSLDDPLQKYMPEFSDMSVKVGNDKKSNQNDITTGKSIEKVETNGKHEVEAATEKVTIRHLFSMAGGFNYNLCSDEIKNALKKGCDTTKGIISALSKSALDFEPGTHFQYSLCHDVLGALIEIWSGKKFSEYFNENICIPLGLKHTYFCKHDNTDNKNLASLYSICDGKFEKQKLINVYEISDNYESGGAGLISCTEDYSVFIDALANDGIAYNGYRLLKKETIDLLRTNQLNEQQYIDFQALRKGYGYGLGVRTHMFPDISKSLSPIGEFGWDGAAGAFSMIDPVNHISLTYFQHCMNWDIKTQNSMRNELYRCLTE